MSDLNWLVSVTIIIQIEIVVLLMVLFGGKK